MWWKSVVSDFQQGDDPTLKGWRGLRAVTSLKIVIPKKRFFEFFNEVYALAVDRFLARVMIRRNLTRGDQICFPYCCTQQNSWLTSSMSRGHCVILSRVFIPSTLYRKSWKHHQILLVPYSGLDRNFQTVSSLITCVINRQTLQSVARLVKWSHRHWLQSFLIS